MLFRGTRTQWQHAIYQNIFLLNIIFWLVHIVPSLTSIPCMQQYVLFADLHRNYIENVKYMRF